eukprot:Ihof_evm12s12 gene=Ihof_evmTU12s12
MLSNFVIVACLAMLSERAVELALTKVLQLSNNAYNAANTLGNGAVELGGGLDTNHGGYIAE